MRKETVVIRVYKTTRANLRLAAAYEDKDMQDIAEEVFNEYVKKKGHRK